ncbi:MAG: hypothetical protein M3Z16_05185 [Pseudomonadota bacterium]|nr:hypothetical protein [Pseudomonadota bacterium]
MPRARPIHRRSRAPVFFASSLALATLTVATVATAEPIRPTRDDEIVETLSTGFGERAEQRRLRSALAARPRDAALAVAMAKRELDQARASGDPRFAGLALAALSPWPDAASAPDAVLLARATLQQYLHEFTASVATLQTLLARPSGSRNGQAWLTLATVLRVQGRFVDSDAACRQVERTSSRLYGSACLAENASLRGDAAAARARFAALLAEPETSAATKAWLETSLAELEQRDGRPREAERAFRAALSAEPDAYATIAYADLLIDQQRGREALALLAKWPRTDAVVLRLAIAGQQARSAAAAADAADMRERIALANQRPGAEKFHGREQAMFALLVEHDAHRALTLARGNVEQQREPLDLLVLARAARASGDAAALAEVKALRASLGLHDRRLDGLL